MEGIISIEKSGPKGYEYQYKTSVLIGVSVDLNKYPELFVEKSEGEDISLIYKQTGEIIEYQVKHESSPIDLVLLISWLCHFSKNKSNSNLLLKVFNNKKKIIFITRARCSDEVLFFKSKIYDYDEHEITSINMKLINGFIQKLENSSFKDNKLGNERSDFCKLQAKMYKKDTNNLKLALSRILIWECVDIMD